MQISQNNSSLSWLTAFRFEQFRNDSVQRFGDELADTEKRSAKFSAESKKAAASHGSERDWVAASAPSDDGNSREPAGAAAVSSPTQTSISYA